MAGWRKGLAVGLAALTLSLPDSISSGTNLSYGDPVQENENVPLKMDINAVDSDNDGYYEHFSLKSFLDTKEGADTVNKIELYNSGNDDFLDRVRVENVPAAFDENDGSYLGRAYLTNIETYNFHDNDGFPFDYKSYTSVSSYDGKTVDTTREYENLIRKGVLDNFGEESLSRVEKIAGFADKLDESKVEKVKEFSYNDIQRYKVLR